MRTKTLQERAMDQRMNRLARYRAFNAETGEYLHISGEFFVSSDFLAWRGDDKQFEAIAKLWETRGVQIKRRVFRSHPRWDDIPSDV